jgi:hypothetical protein
MPATGTAMTGGTETQTAMVMPVETGTATGAGMGIGMGTVLQNIPMPAEMAKAMKRRMNS